MGARPLAEHRRVGDEAAILAPHMELIAGRFEHESQRRLGGEVKAELVRRARGGAGKAAVDRAVQMAAQDALDLRMAGYDRSERRAVLQPARSMRSMPVRKGGWCIISKTGRSGAAAR